MIVINKKRLLNILGMVFISLFVFSFQIAKEEKTKETVSLPVSNKVIVIDAGHGVPDERSRELITVQQRHKQI